MDSIIIAQGAEAKLYRKDDILIKDRIKKSYRIKEIDDKLRKERTTMEAKLLREARRVGVLTPKILNTTDTTIEMEFIDGKKIKDILDSQIELSEKIGYNIGKLHEAGIIHGDLTTSNMILKEKIYFIDFGLGFFSKRIEDQATDLHLLKEAIKSTHFKNLEIIWKNIIKGYGNSKKVLEKLEEIEKRGRYKK